MFLLHIVKKPSKNDTSVRMQKMPKEGLRWLLLSPLELNHVTASLAAHCDASIPASEGLYSHGTASKLEDDYLSSKQEEAPPLD